MGARRLVPTPEVTSLGWEGENHIRFSHSCQSLDAHKEQSSQCWTMPSEALLCQASCTQEGPHKCWHGSWCLHTVQMGWEGLFIKCKGQNLCQQPLQPTDNTLGKHSLNKWDELSPQQPVPG